MKKSKLYPLIFTLVIFPLLTMAQENVLAELEKIAIIDQKNNDAHARWNSVGNGYLSS
jgi:hypothetical protein